jgi:hypothetical protein
MPTFGPFEIGALVFVVIVLVFGESVNRNKRATASQRQFVRWLTIVAFVLVLWVMLRGALTAPPA